MCLCILYCKWLSDTHVQRGSIFRMFRSTRSLLQFWASCSSWTLASCDYWFAWFIPKKTMAFTCRFYKDSTTSCASCIDFKSCWSNALHIAKEFQKYPPSLKLTGTAHENRPKPKRKKGNLQSSVFRCKLLVSGRVVTSSRLFPRLYHSARLESWQGMFHILTHPMTWSPCMTGVCTWNTSNTRGRVWSLRGGCLIFGWCLTSHQSPWNDLQYSYWRNYCKRHETHSDSISMDIHTFHANPGECAFQQI